MIVFCRDLFVVHGFDVALDVKVNELPDWHGGVDAYGLGNRNLERPVIAEADVALACRGMDIDTQASDTGFAFEEGHVLVRLGVLEGRAEISDSRF